MGVGELSWTLFGFVMLLFLARTRVHVPRGFALIILFLTWAALSVIGIDSAGRLLGFVFRYGQLLGAMVAFVYIYNARANLSNLRIYGLFTIFWIWVVAGGYAGMMFPTAVIQTPLSYVLPQGLMANDLVSQMAIRRLSQFQEDAWIYVDPRPSAPFLYTNNWGNAYSLLLPIAVMYATMVRSRLRRALVITIIPLSFIPAFLTLNRGMFLGLGIVLGCFLIRMALVGNVRALVGASLLSALAGASLMFLPVMERLDSRVDESGTNEGRVGVYSETIRRAVESPLFGYGGPQAVESSASILPPAGTHGQVWMVLFSHGFIGLALFLGVLAWMTLRSLSWQGTEGAVATGILVAGIVESFYYGTLGAGLFITMVIGALAFRSTQEGHRFPPREEATS
ncbi:O-antigen ligase family protein [Ornithinimicrobium faecis]|uniref:O-antigen ligase family protein n=1 Tax=Ornithinimicrobium faecis TaxID=2934158 RepID=UPI002117A4A9|nr:O-antigen ligase family protein [Ornithinimicrobium sp. HY1745]